MQKKVVKGDFQEYIHTVGMSYHQVDNIFFPNFYNKYIFHQNWMSFFCSLKLHILSYDGEWRTLIKSPTLLPASNLKSYSTGEHLMHEHFKNHRKMLIINSQKPFDIGVCGTSITTSGENKQILYL